MAAPASTLPAKSSASGESRRSAMPAASSSRDSATAVSRPIRRASRGAAGANAPKQRTGSVVSRPARAEDSPVSARRSPRTGATATTAGRWLSATPTMAAARRTEAVRERVTSATGGAPPRADPRVGGLVDQDEPPRHPVAGVVVDEQRLRRAQLDPADVVQAELPGLRLAVQRVDVEPVLELLDHAADGAGRVLDRHPLAGAQRLVGHPADQGVEVLGRMWRVGRAADQITAGDVEVVGEPDGHR